LFLLFFRIFIGFQWVLISCQYIAQLVIPDVPEDVEIQLKRIAFIHQKIIEKVADEDYGEESLMEVDVGVDESSERHKTKHWCSCCRFGHVTTGKTKVKEITDEYDVFPYPRNLVPETWPLPLTEADNANVAVRNRKVVKTDDNVKATESRFQSYVTSAAVHITPVSSSPTANDNSVQNPVFRSTTESKL
jgi:hypothetical protein